MKAAILFYRQSHGATDATWKDVSAELVKELSCMEEIKVLSHSRSPISQQGNGLWLCRVICQQIFVCQAATAASPEQDALR